MATGKTVEETLSQFKEALQMQPEEIVNDGEDIPKAKELSQHISDEVFKKDEIADVYFITEEKTRMVFVP